MRSILLAFLIFITGPLVAQNSIMEGKLDWSNWESGVSSVKKKEILNAFVQSTDALPAFIAKQYADGRNHSAFHLLDLDFDSQIDIVFNGNTGTGNGVILFRKNGTRYVQSNILGGIIADLGRSKLSGHIEFKIQQDPPGQEHYRLIVNMSIRPNDFKMLTSAEYSYKTKTELPDTYFSPKPFVTKTSHYNLRAQPKLDSKSSGWAEHIDGNVVAVYPQGSVGKAIGQKTDEAGRVWWFVIMENNIPPTRSLLVYRKPTNRSMGWMSSKFLVEIRP